MWKQYLIFSSLVCPFAAGHSLGQHGLDGGDPSSVPSLPEITGPFEVTVTFRFNKISTGDGWQRVFDFGNGAGKDNIVLTQRYRRREAWFTVFCHNNIPTTFEDILVTETLTEGELTTFKVGLDTTGLMYMIKDGTLLDSKSTTCIPSNVSRSNKYLGISNWNNNEPLHGSVVGIEVTNYGDGRGLEAMKFKSFPGQVRTGAFTASMWARFDRLSPPSYAYHPNGSQRLFDFSGDGGSGDNQITLKQVGNSTDIEFVIDQNGSTFSVVAYDAIVIDEFALWHAGVNVNGTMWIQKNDTILATASGDLPISAFRRNLLFGQSLDPLDFPLDGVVLGFRLDPVFAS